MGWSHRLPEIVLPLTVATAPRLICTPFCAIAAVLPTPVIVLPVTEPPEPVASMTMPPFW